MNNTIARVTIYNITVDRTVIEEFSLPVNYKSPLRKEGDYEPEEIEVDESELDKYIDYQVSRFNTTHSIAIYVTYTDIQKTYLVYVQNLEIDC